jgi:hypothetical protein
VRALIVPRSGAAPGDHWYAFVSERVEAGVVPGLSGAQVREPRPDERGAARGLVLVAHEDALWRLADVGPMAAGVLLVAPPDAQGEWDAEGRLRVLLSDDPGHEESERLWEERGAEVAIRPGGRRFHGAHEISVLINLAALAMEIAEGGRG